MGITTGLEQAVIERYLSSRPDYYGEEALCQAKLSTIREMLDDPAFIGGERKALKAILEVKL